MKKIDQIGTKRYVFGAIQMLALKQDTAMERTLRPFDVTTKQWFLHVMLENFFNTPPTLKQLAKEMGTSYQNVKQVALKLEKKDLIKLYKDPKDARTTRLQLTEKSESFWDQIQAPANLFFESFYNDISDEDLETTKRTIDKFISNIESLERLNKYKL